MIISVTKIFNIKNNLKENVTLLMISSLVDIKCFLKIA